MQRQKRFLVTAGNTREKIDSVRDWGNIFTGNTGFSIATSLCAIGEVDLVSSNPAHLQRARTSTPMRAFEFRTHADLMDCLENRMRRDQYDAVFMTAAVSDYSPSGTFEIIAVDRAEGSSIECWKVRNVQAGKVKSTHQAIAVQGVPTTKIVDRFRTDWNHRGLLVKFKLEVGITPDELIQIGKRSRLASGADYLVANTLDMVSGESAGAYLLSEGGYEWIPRASLAQTLAKLVASHITTLEPVPSP
jgi:phosphopantothenoylcysteine synthetase/decarboxylase